MRVGAFELKEPLPELQEPHALAILRPWVDAGGVGSLVLSRLEAQLEAQELGRLARPGNFFDFTRYRPTIYTHEGHRQLVIPNSIVTYSRHGARNFLFLHLLESHMLGETYAEAVLQLLRRFGVKRYCLIGSMYDMVPHTRPLLVTGSALGKSAEEDCKRVGVRSSDYQGPTTITSLVSQRAPETGIETMSLIVHLPQYTELEEDNTGQVRLLEVLGYLYDIQVDETDIRKAEQQRKQIDAAVDQDMRLKSIVAQLEAHYDARTAEIEQEETPNLSPEMEKFLREMEKRFNQG